jgi:hypothetical protein
MLFGSYSTGPINARRDKQAKSKPLFGNEQIFLNSFYLKKSPTVPTFRISPPAGPEADEPDCNKESFHYTLTTKYRAGRLPRVLKQQFW